MQAVVEKHLEVCSAGDLTSIEEELKKLIGSMEKRSKIVAEEKGNWSGIIKEKTTDPIADQSAKKATSLLDLDESGRIADGLKEQLKRVQFLMRFPKRLGVSFLGEEVLAYAIGKWNRERKIPVRMPRYGIFTLDFPFFGISLKKNWSWESEDWKKRSVLCFKKDGSKMMIPEVLAISVRDTLFSEKEPLLESEEVEHGSSSTRYYFSQLVVPLPLAPDQKTEIRIRELERAFVEQGGAVFLIAEAPQPWRLTTEEIIVPIPPPSCPLIVGVIENTVFYLGKYKPTQKENYVIAEFVV